MKEQMLFRSTRERDEYIEKNFPKRKCTTTPGVYKLPKGGLLYVWLNDVIVVRKD